VPSIFERPIAVTGIGLCSSLGDFRTACAAARAGLSRPTELPDFPVYDGDLDGEVPAVGYPIQGFEGFRGVGRLATMAADAFDDLASTCDLASVVDPVFYLAVTNPRHRRRPPEAPPTDRRALRETEAADWDKLEAVAKAVIDVTGLGIPANRRQIFDDGAAALARAFADAGAHLVRGHVRAALVCTTDSLIERPVLSWLFDAYRLKGPEASTGLMPGEAAAFVLLELASEAKHAGRPVLALLRGAQIAPGESPLGLDRPPRANELLQVALPLATVPGAPVPWFLSDQNGETWRAMEWADFLIRARDRHPDVAGAPLWYPAIPFGDAGAAAPALALAMASASFRRSYAPSPAAVVVATGDHGARAAFRADAPTG